MSADNVIKLRPPPLDLLTERGPEPFASTSGSTAVATLASTIAFSGRTNLTVSPDEWRKPQRRKVYAAIDALFPSGLPIEFQSKKIAAEVISYCVEQGWPEPKPKTIQRAIRDRYPTLTVGST